MVVSLQEKGNCTNDRDHSLERTPLEGAEVEVHGSNSVSVEDWEVIAGKEEQISTSMNNRRGEEYSDKG